jgi:hypothetical protein
MHALPELQRQFARAILQPHAGVILTGFKPGGHMEIYAGGYKTRLADALRDNFPTLHRVLGDEAFDALAHAYIDATPSHYRSIRWFGRELEAFARRNASILPHAALLDLLQMDWAIGTAFDAADAPPLRAGQLRAVTPEHWAAISLVPHPSVTVLWLEWAVEPIWRAATREMNEAGASHDSEAPEANPHHLLIWRDGLEARWRVLTDDEARAFAQIGSRSNFGALCEYLASQINQTDAAQTAATYLARWVADGLLTDTLTAAANQSGQAIC